MAKYQIAYSCGHTDTKQLFGKEADRQRYIAWAADHGTCPACRAADADTALANIEAEYNLPTLDGSDKQVAWARSLRAKRIEQIVAHIDSLRPRLKPGTETAFEDQMAACMTALCGQSAARWWIDNRDVAHNALLAKVAGR